MLLLDSTQTLPDALDGYRPSKATWDNAETLAYGMASYIDHSCFY